MRELPDIRNEVRGYFGAVKKALVYNVKEGENCAPLLMTVLLTPEGQVDLGKPDTVAIVPRWSTKAGKKQWVVETVLFANRYAECLILCGSGTGTYSGFGPGEVSYIFVTMYLKGFHPWTLAQVYTVVEKEVIFDVECCSSDGTVSFFDLPGLWPEEVPL
jgi:hypothetical protein